MRRHRQLWMPPNPYNPPVIVKPFTENNNNNMPPLILDKPTALDKPSNTASLDPPNNTESSFKLVPFPRGDFKRVANQPIITEETGPKRLQLALLTELNMRSSNTTLKQKQKFWVDREEFVLAMDPWQALKGHFFVTSPDQDKTLKLDRPILERFCKLCGVCLKHLKRMTDGQLRRLARQMIDGCEVLIWKS